MKVRLKPVDVEPGHDLLFTVAKNKRGAIMASRPARKKDKHKNAKALQDHSSPPYSSGHSKLRGQQKHSVHPDAKCEPDKAFFCVDGSIFSSIGELAKAFDTMSDDTFYYHANDWKNDFHNWIKDVFGMGELAEKLLAAKTKDRHQIILLEWEVGK